MSGGEQRRRAGDVKPDPEWYRAIGGDATVKQVLEVFYERVFADPLLGRFFVRTDKPTIRGKQFGFLKRCFTGEADAYMGQRPRNAHHGMVISDEQFDHRAGLLRQVLVEVGLAPADVDRWMAVEEVFRRQIVKDRPWPLFYRGQATYWAEEAKEERLAVDSSCDSCGGEVAAGGSLWLVGDSARCAACAATPAEDQ